jgi:hypothetical protein
MLLALLFACVRPTDTGAPPSDDTAPAHDTVPDSPADSPKDSTGDSPADSPNDSPADSPADTAPNSWRSALYPEDWTPDFTSSDGHFLHDFSYAGYHAGQDALPSPLPGAVYDVTTYGADPTGATDATSAVQAAINAAAASHATAIVDFPAGTYRFDGLLTVRAPNIVLRGAGSSASYLYFTRTDGMSDTSHLTFSGTITQGADHLLTVDGENRSRTVQLADVSDLAVGDAVAIGWTITDAFTEEHGMTGVWVSFTNQWKTMFRRTITGIDPTTGTVTLDVPLRYPAKMRDGASLRVESGYLTEVGVQDLAVSTVNDWTTAWTVDRTHAIGLVGVRDGWISNVNSWESPLSTDGRGKHLLSGGFLVQDSRRVTVSDCDLENAQNRGDNGNGYLYEVMRSNEVLTRDSVGKNGRHNFIQNWDFGTSGCVWLRTYSSGGHSYYADWDPIGWNSYSEFHHSLAMANLIDQSTATDGWQAVNRQAESSGAGHSATQTVWWNIDGGGYLRSLQYGDGYVIGTDGMDVHVDPSEWDWNSSGEGTEPEDWTEGVDASDPIEPASLYEDQLSRRLSR